MVHLLHRLYGVDAPAALCQLYRRTSITASHVSFIRICDCRIFRLLPHFFAYFSKVRMSHIFSALIGIFDGNFDIIFVFLLPISTRFRYLDLVANRMTPSMSSIRTPAERDGVVGFKQFYTIFPLRISYLCSPQFCIKCHIERTWGCSVAEWLACWTQAQKGLGSNRSRDAVG